MEFHGFTYFSHVSCSCRFRGSCGWWHIWKMHLFCCCFHRKRKVLFFNLYCDLLLRESFLTVKEDDLLYASLVLARLVSHRHILANGLNKIFEHNIRFSLMENSPSIEFWLFPEDRPLSLCIRQSAFRLYLARTELSSSFWKPPWKSCIVSLYLGSEEWERVQNRSRQCSKKIKTKIHFNCCDNSFVSSFWNIHLSLSIIGEGVQTGERVSSRIHNVPSLGVGVLQLRVKRPGIG